MKSFRRNALWLSLLLLAGCSRDFWSQFSGFRLVQTDGYRFDFRGQTATGQEEGEIPAEVSDLDITHSFGNVRVVASREKPKWSWKLTCWADTQETAKSHAEAIELIVEIKDNRLSCNLQLPKPPVPDLRGVKSELTLWVPPSAKVAVNNRHGETDVSGIEQSVVVRCEHSALRLADLKSDVDASTSFGQLTAERIAGGTLTNKHGGLTAQDIRGKLQASTSFSGLLVEQVSGDLVATNKHGPVTARRIGGEARIRSGYAAVEVEAIGGPTNVANEHGRVSVVNVSQHAEVRTSFAGIEIREVKGGVTAYNEHGDIVGKKIQGAIKAETSFGRIDLKVEATEVACKNQHGSIRLGLLSPDLRRIEAETSFGTLEISLAPDISPTIDASARHGKVRSDFPVRSAEVAEKDPGDREGETPRLMLRNSHGDVTIRKATAEKQL
jgi:hypothetical protein